MDQNQPQQTQSIPQPVAQIPPSGNNFLLIGIIALAAGIIGSGATYLALNSQKTNQPSPTPVVQTQPTPTPDPTANWKTYTNTKYGYSIKYPPSWKLSEFSNIVGIYPPGVDLLPTLAPNETGSDIPPGITIEIINEPFSSTISTFNDSFITQKEIITINGIQGYYYFLERGGGPSSIYFDLPYRNKILRFDLTLRQIDTQMRNTDELTFKQILSTFRFD